MKFLTKIFIIYYFILISFSYAEKINSINIKGNKRIANETIIMFSKTAINDEITGKYQLNKIFKNISSYYC